MSSSKLLASVAAVKEETFIEGNVEPLKLKPAILEAQRIHVQNVIGTKLYTYFLNAVNESGELSGCTAIQTTFYKDYLVPCLAKYAEAEYSLGGTFQRSNVGMIKAGSERIDKQKAANMDEISFVYSRTFEKAESLAQRAVNFIKHKDNYADLGVMYYETDQNLPPAPTAFQFPIYTGPAR